MNFLWTRAINNIPVINRLALEKGVFILERKTVEVLWPSDREDREKKDGKLRVAAYCRLSKILNEKHLDSLENQLNHYTYYLTNHENYKLMGLYYDGDISGTTINNRPGFKRLLRHCEEGLIDLVITKSISRFSRNAKDLLEVVNHLSELGIPIIFETENINTLERKNKFFLTALAGLSQEEIVSISNNKIWSNNKKFLSGKPPNRRQYGYVLSETEDGTTHIIYDEEAKVIRDIFKMFIGGMRINEITRLLTDKSVETAGGHTVWTHTLVRNLLTNRMYVGEQIINNNQYYYNRKVSFLRDIGRDIYIIENAYPRIISNEEFEKAQEILMELKVKKSMGTISPHSCSKRIRCGLCDVAYHKNKRKNDTEWVCSIKQKQSRLCDSPRLSDKKILPLMKEAFQLMFDFNNPDILQELMDELEWINKNDRFEFHRLSLLSQLQIAKERLKQHPENDELIREKEKKEKDIIDFEHLATMIEDDRKYRENAIEILGRAKSPEDFLSKANIDLLRAWIMEITIFTLKDYQVHWFNDLYTTVGNCEKHKDNMEVKRASLVEGTLILKPSKKTKNIFVEEDYQDTITSLRDPPSLKLRGDKVQVAKVEDYSFIKLEDRIRKEIKESKKLGLESSRNKERIAVYARVSTDDPRQLNSLEAQMAYYTYYILKNPDYRLVQVYYDEGISGTKAENRPGFQQMIADCKKGKIDRIITKSISRFARNTVDCLEYVRELKSIGISILFEKEEIDSKENDGEILLTVYSALAQEESRSLGENIAWSRRKKAERGDIKLSTLPYGYTYNKDGSWEINRDEAKIIKRIYDERLSGKSVLGITKDLTNDGVPSPKNNKVWGQTTVRKILISVVYKGDILYQNKYTNDTIAGRRVKNNGELPMYYFEEHHEAIIDRKMWDAVQNMLPNGVSKNQRKKRTYHDREEFSKVFRCGSCGCLILHISDNRRKGYHNWRCKAAVVKNYSDNCYEKGIREENIEHTFMAMLQEMKESKNLTKLVNEAIESIKLKPYEMERLHSLQTEIENRYQSLYDIVEEGKKHGEDTEAIKIMSDGIMELHDRIRTLEDRIEKVKDMKEELKWLRKELLMLEAFDPKEERVPFRKDIFTRIVKAGTFHTDGVIEYTLSLGIKWIAKDNLEEFWKLPMKEEFKQN